MIENIELRAFILENLSFARTIVIKNEDLAILDNALMLKHYGLNSGDDKSKWRYYMNLNGEYHSTDEMMVIKSLDNNEDISFTKTNLNEHPATKRAYRLGGYYFSRLTAKYPHQLGLIQGIINPIPQEEAVSAENYKILRYTKEYVENNESQLIPDLQAYINNLTYQCFSTEYKYTDCLMLPVLIAHAHEGIFKYLLQNRFENRKTRHAHSFYIWSHLQSRGISPIHKEMLNEKQTMWLFRNIDWVLRNLGKDETFKQLIEILLTERNITLSKYDIVYTTEDIKKTFDPNAVFYSERLNLIETKGLNAKFTPIKDVMTKEIPESLDNEINYEKFLSSTVYESTYSEQTNYPTKVLNSELVDTTNRKHETFFHILNNELIYLAGKNLYNINLDIEDPVTGVYQRLSIKDCVVMWYHLLNCYNGHTLCDKIPMFYYKDVMKISPPTAKQMSALSAKPFVHERWCEDALKLHVRQTRMVSPSLFYENALAIYHNKWKHKKMYSQWPSIGYYSRRKNAILSMYETGFMQLTTKKTYKEFVDQFKFDFSEYHKDEYFALMWEIWKKMTGWDQFTHLTIAQVQESMLSLMKELSSYTVQYVYSTQLQDGWYEGGLDLFTENPMLLSGKHNGQLEQESGVEADRIDIPHRVVMIVNEEEESFYLDDRLDSGDTIIVPEVSTNVFESPKLYEVDLGNDKDDGFHSSQLMMSDFKLREFTGTTPYQLEDFIPKGGNSYNKHTLKEMLVERFDGPSVVGPWEAIGIEIVNNGLDNNGVANNVDGFAYTQYNRTVKSNNVTTYFVGFVPESTGEHVIKLDVKAKHKETGEITYIRFDYPIKVKANTWSVQFNIPSSVKINTSFGITPMIANFSSNTAPVANEDIESHPEVVSYFTAFKEEATLKGRYLKLEPPENLPVLYVLETKSDSKDDTAKHFYFMQGTVPSDRLYDPLEDPEFDPKPFYNEADTNAITLEKFSVTAFNKGWTATNLYIKKVNGKYPTDKVKTDYGVFKDYLSPKLTESKFTDKTTNEKIIRTFEWLYVPAKTGVVLDMVLELTNVDGTVVERPFTYAPTVIDHKVAYTYDILPYAGFCFGKGELTDVTLTVNNFNSNTFTINKAYPPTINPSLIVSNIAFELSDNNSKVSGNKISGFSVKPHVHTPLPLSTDYVWVVKLEGHAKTAAGNELILYPYGLVTIAKNEVIDYEEYGTLTAIDWNTHNTLYRDMVNPVRFAFKTLSNGWDITGFDYKVTDNTLIKEKIESTYTFKSHIKSGKLKDGTQTLPSGCTDWLTFYGMHGYYGTEMSLAVYVNLKNKFTNKTKSVKHYLNVKTNDTRITLKTKTPAKLYGGMTNKVQAVWNNSPYSVHEKYTLQSVEGVFINMENIKGGSNYNQIATGVWNNDTTASVTLPKGPLIKSGTITLINKKALRTHDSAYMSTSVQDVFYFGICTYTPSEVIDFAPITLSDFGFTSLSSTFYQGASCTHIVLYNKNRIETELAATIKSVTLKGYYTTSGNPTFISQMGVSGNIDDYNMRINDITTLPSDTPKGKEDYSGKAVTFIPRKSGTQTFTLLFTVSRDGVTEDYPCDFVIDVKPKVSVINFVKGTDKPYFLLGDTSTTQIALNDIPTDVESNKITLLKNNNHTYLKLIEGNEKDTLDINIDSNNKGDLDFVVGYETRIKTYSANDPRGLRHYLDTLEIPLSLTYKLSDIKSADIIVERIIPDTQFKDSESKYEIFRLLNNIKGWDITRISMRDYTYFNHYFTYEGLTKTNDKLGSKVAEGVQTFNGYKAETGQTLYPFFYGGNKQFSPYYVIELTNKYLANNKTLEITGYIEHTLGNAALKLNLKYDIINIGKANKLEGGIEGLSEINVKEGMVLTGPEVYTFSRNESLVKFDSTSTTLTLDSKYSNTVDGGVYIAYIYTLRNKNGVRSINDRSYRAVQYIPNSDMLAGVELFDMTASSNVLYAGAINKIKFFSANIYNLNKLGWEIVTVDVKGMRDGKQDKTLVRGEEVGLSFEDIYETYNERTPGTGVVMYDYYVKFIPEDYEGVEGKRTFTFTLTAKKDNKTFEFDFSISRKVIKENKKISFLIADKNQDEIKHHYAANTEPYLDYLIFKNHGISYPTFGGAYLKPYGESKDVMLPHEVPKANSVGNGRCKVYLEFTGESQHDYTYRVIYNNQFSAEGAQTGMVGFLGYLKIEKGYVRDYDKIPDSVFNINPLFQRYAYQNEYYSEPGVSVANYDGLTMDENIWIGLQQEGDWILKEIVTEGGNKEVFSLTGSSNLSDSQYKYWSVMFIPKKTGTFKLVGSGKIKAEYTNYARVAKVEMAITVKAPRLINSVEVRRYWGDVSNKQFVINPLGPRHPMGRLKDWRAGGDVVSHKELFIINDKSAKLSTGPNGGFNEFCGIKPNDLTKQLKYAGTYFHSATKKKSLFNYTRFYVEGTLNDLHGYEVVLVSEVNNLDTEQTNKTLTLTYQLCYKAEPVEYNLSEYLKKATMYKDGLKNTFTVSGNSIIVPITKEGYSVQVHHVDKLKDVEVTLSTISVGWKGQERFAEFDQCFETMEGNLFISLFYYNGIYGDRTLKDWSVTIDGKTIPVTPHEVNDDYYSIILTKPDANYVFKTNSYIVIKFNEANVTGTQLVEGYLNF